MLGISTEWYTKIEQGRVSTLSIRIVNALGKALQLNKAEFLHLKTLRAGKKVQISNMKSRLAYRIWSGR